MAIIARVNRSKTAAELKDAANRSAARYIRRLAEAQEPADREALAALVWGFYFKMKDAGLLEDAVAVRKLLRVKYGYWKSVGVEPDIVAA